MVKGITHIRVWKKEKIFAKKYFDYSHMKAIVDFHDSVGNLWLRMRVEYSVATVIAISILGITLAKETDLINNFNLALVGVLMMYLINVSNFTGMLIYSTTTIMREMAVVERMQEYAETTDIEESEDIRLEKLEKNDEKQQI